MLEWLKGILKDAYTEDIDKAVSAEIGKGFVSKADFNAVNETKKTLEKTVTERDGQLEQLKKLDPEKLQGEITRLTNENTASKTEYEKQLAAAKLDYALEARLMKEGVVSTKAVKALLDGSKISLDGENLIGVDDQIKALKESDKWAFPPAPDVPGAGGNPAAAGDTKAPLPTGVQIF